MKIYNRSKTIKVCWPQRNANETRGGHALILTRNDWLPTTSVSTRWFRFRESVFT